MRYMCGGPCGVAFIQIPSMLCMAGLFCFFPSAKQAWVFQSRRIATHALHVWRTLWGCIHSNPFHAVHGWSFLFRLFTQESLGFSKSKDCHPCVACVADLVGLHSNEKLGLALRALVFFVFSLPLSKLGFFKVEGLPPMRCMCGGPCGVAFIQIPSMLCMAGLFCFDSSLKQARVFQSRRIATHALHVWRTLWGCIPTKSSVSLCEPWSFLFFSFR